MFDHGPGGGEPGQVAGLGEDRRGPDRGQPVDAGHQRGQAELVQDGDHPGLDRRRAWPGRRPSRPGSTRSVRTPPAGAPPPRRCRSGRRTGARTIRRHGRTPPRRVTSARTARSNRAAPERVGCGPGPRRRGRTTTVMAATHVAERNGCFAASSAAGHTHSSRSRICLHAPHVLLEQLLAAGAEVPQPGPRAFGRRPVRAGSSAAARSAGRSARRPCRRSCPWSGPRSCAPTTTAPAARTRTTCRARRRAAPAPATGARSAHTATVTPANPARGGPVGGPVQRRPEVPRLAPERAPRQHLGVVVGDDDHLLAVGQVDPDDRVRHRHRLPQPRQPRVAVPIPTRNTTCDLSPTGRVAQPGRFARPPSPSDRFTASSNVCSCRPRMTSAVTGSPWRTARANSLRNTGHAAS